MPTIVSKDIKPDGTGDYLTINAFLAGEERDLTGWDHVAKGVIYSGGNVLSGYAAVPGGFVTDATRYIWLIAAAGHEHNGYWDTSKAYGLVASGQAYCIVSGRTIHIENMQIQSTDVLGTIMCGGFGGLTLRRCIVRSLGVNAVAVLLPSWGASATNVIENCVLIADGTGETKPIDVASERGGYSVTVNNCVLVSRTASIPYIAIGILAAYAGDVVTSQNNYIFCESIAGSTCYYSGGGTINKGANDATFNAEVTTPALRNIAYSAANFLDVTPGSENLHLTTGSALRGVGENLSATFTDDIDGDTRPSLPAPWAIGADEPSNVYDADFSDGSVGGDTTTSSMLYSGDVVEGAEGADSAPLPLGQLLADMVDQGIVSDPVLPAGDYFGLVVEGISFAEQGSEDSYVPGDWVDGGIFGDFFSAPPSGRIYLRPFRAYPTMVKVGQKPTMTVTVGSPETRATV